MRRLTGVLLMLALCSAGATLVIGSGHFARGILGAGPRASLATRLTGLWRVTGIQMLCPGVVSAGETLRFRPVPPESADLVTRRGTRAAVPSAPSAPSTPAPPAPHEAPQVVKSGDVMRVGSDIHVARDEVVRGSVSAISGDVTVDGHVEGDVSALRGDVYLGPTARVDGDVVSAGGQIHEEPGAYVGGQRVTALPGTRVGRVHRITEHAVERHVGRVVASVIWMLVLLGLAWAVTQLAPGRTAAAVATLQRAPLLSSGIGGLILALIIPSVIALSLVVALLCITIIGIPFALAALLGYGMFLVVFGIWGFIVGAGGVGAWVVRRRGGASAPVEAAPGPGSISRAVLTGVALLTGMLVLGSLFRAVGLLFPFRVLGGFMFVIGIILMSVVTVAGGGAWVRSEFETGMLGRWWQRRRQPPVVPVTPAPTPPPPPAPPAPPSPPSAYAPPAADSWTPPPTG